MYAYDLYQLVSVILLHGDYDITKNCENGMANMNGHIM